MELHELDNGIVLLNDSYNANPESMRAAIDALVSIGADAAVHRTVAVLGVMRELGADSEPSHRELGEYAAARVDQLLVIGPEASGIHDGAPARALTSTTTPRPSTGSARTCTRVTRFSSRPPGARASTRSPPPFSSVGQ